MEEDKTPTTGRKSVGFWLQWIRAAKKAADRHWQDANEAWAEYENDKEKVQSSGADAPTRVYPIYWSSCKVMEPAYWSRIPNVYARRRFDINDPIAMTGSLIVERLSEWLKDTSCLDSTMRCAVQDLIHADKATTQVIYEADVKKSTRRMELQASEPDDGGAVSYLSDGVAYDGEVLSDDGGYFFNQEHEEAENQRLYLAPLYYDEVLHTPEAKSEDQITEKAYFFSLTKAEAEAKFPNLSGNISWKKKKQEESATKGEDSVEEYLEGWECYCKTTRTVYWVSEQYNSDFLKTASDPYGIRNFFPSPPFVIGSKPRKSLYPTPAYVHVRATLKQLHSLYAKTFELIKGIRRRALVDGATPELITALNDLSDNEFVTVSNLNKMLEKGGLQNMIWYIPVQELVSAISELNTLDAQFKDNFYEWFGVPDILRGSSDPVETAAAQEIKQGAANDRFKNYKESVAKLARDSLEMLLDMAFHLFTDDRIAEIVGFQYMEPQHRERFPQALQMLRSDEDRMIRLEIETDTTSYLDRAQRQQRRATILGMVTDALSKVSSMTPRSAEAKTAMRAVLLSMDGVDGGKDFEDGVRQSMEELMEEQKNPPPPPPPDAAVMRVELDKERFAFERELQTAKIQMEQAAAQFEQELKGRELAIKEADVSHKIESETIWTQMEAQLENLKLGLESQKQEFEASLAQAELALKERILELDTNDAETAKMLETHKAVIEQTEQRAKHLFEEEYLNLEKFKVRLDEQEKFLEERRLMLQHMTESAKIAQSQQPQTSAPSAQPINIAVHIPKRGKKSGKIVHEDGTETTVEMTEAEDDE